MPSPVTHAAVGYLLSRYLLTGCTGLRPGMIWAGVALSCLPDIDAAAGLLLGDMGRYHNHMMSSPFFALLVACGAGAVAWRAGAAVRPWFTLTLVCYLAHITLDFFTQGRGIMLLWPFSETRFRPPFSLFYGVHWSDGLISSRHLWTLLTELGMLAVLGLVLAVYLRFSRQGARNEPGNPAA